MARPDSMSRRQFQVHLRIEEGFSWFAHQRTNRACYVAIDYKHIHKGLVPSKRNNSTKHFSGSMISTLRKCEYLLNDARTSPFNPMFFMFLSKLWKSTV